MDRREHVLIAGSGIAGTTAAIALQRAGIRATIFEAYPADAESAGAFLTIAVNGLSALRAVGLDGPVEAAGFASPAIELRSGTGKRLGELPLGGTLADGRVAYTIKRSALHRVLSDEARRRGIRIEHGKRLVDAAIGGDERVVARFEDGTSATGDLLVGADGVHSRLRRILDPGSPRPRHVPLGNVGGFTDGPPGALRAGTYLMIFGTRAFFGAVASPAGEIWWFANPPSSAELSKEELTAPQCEWKRRLTDLFAADAGPAVDIIRNAKALAATNQYELPRVRTWSRGPLIVIGDAAHAASPTSGQGAALAIEDAVVLAQCLRDLPDRAAALATFERLRRPRVERIVAWASRMNQTKVPGPVGRAIRDLVLPALLKRAGGSQAWVFDHRIDWDRQIPSPAVA